MADGNIDMSPNREGSVKDEKPRLILPGFGRVIESNKGELRCYRSVDETDERIMTVQEQQMLSVMNALTDKPDWHRKVFDKEITKKWTNEALAMRFDTGKPNHLTEKSMKFCLRELKDKARRFESDNLVTVLDMGHSVVKSDTNVPQALAEELFKGIQPLLQVPDHAKDWHPSSNDQVLDIVHPSLYPLVYGRTRILPYDELDLEDCMEYIGKGEVIPAGLPNNGYWSNKYQWLPAEVRFDANDDAKPFFASYINNLHPTKHADLYDTIAKFVDKAMPMWDVCLPLNRSMRSKALDMRRICCDGASYEPNEPEYDEDTWEPTAEQQDHWERTRTLEHPEPRDYESWPKPWNVHSDSFDLCGDEADKLQVIVKIASIELTPERPEYPGGNWHVEGQLNEAIVATAIYYFDCDNVTDSSLAFRQQTEFEDASYEQGRFEALSEIFDVEDFYNDPCIQELGAVATKQGRMLVFPNVLQHRVGKFKLQDSTKPGHRRILVLWLVDPMQQIISTANVPPQQHDWWAENLVREQALPLPVELSKMVADQDNDATMSLDEAKEHRLKIMEERTSYQHAVDEDLRYNTYNFCEH